MSECTAAGVEVHRLPLLSLFAASNHLPEDEALRALFDRFLIRCHVDGLKREAMPRLLAAGWELEGAGNDPSSVTAADLRELSRRVHAIDVKGILDRYADVLLKVCDLGVAISDRRAIKVLKLVADSAVLCGQGAANPIDLWVLLYVWDREEQIAPLTSLVAGVLDPQADEPAPHPLAAPPGLVDGEEFARQLDSAEVESRADMIGLATVARLREHVADLADCPNREAPQAALLLGSEHGVTPLAHDGQQWFSLNPWMGNRDPTRMKSRPALAKGSTLGQPLLSWSGETARDIDLCGLGEHGSIHWGRIRDGTLTSVNSTYGVQEPGYRAATIVRDGLVAGVTSLRIEWLRCDITRFHALEVGRTRSRLGRRLLRRGADQRTGRRLQRRDDRPARRSRCSGTRAAATLPMEIGLRFIKLATRAAMPNGRLHAGYHSGLT